MAENSKIEWADHRFSPWNGTRVVASESMWREPLKWDRIAKLADELWVAVGGEPGIPGTRQHDGRTVVYHGRPRVFCASLADVFEDWTGPMHGPKGGISHTNGGDWRINESSRPLTMRDVRRRLFALIDATPNLDWLLLTKRPENVLRMLPPLQNSKVLGAYTAMEVMTRPNVWLGVSVEDQKQADERIPILLQTPAAVRFLSCEPLIENLGELDLTGIHWVIVGGGSGKGARPMQAEWAQSIRDKCQAAGVPFFFKQWGEFLPPNQDGSVRKTNGGTLQVLNCSDSTDRVGKKAAGRLLDGREWSEFPEAAHA